MLLRRVIEHVKAQQWTAVALDFVIVVLGVFVGLQVQEWNAARGHRAAEVGHLKSMPFSNAVLYRYFFTDERIANVQQILDRHRQLAALIDERQLALGVVHD